MTVIVKPLEPPAINTADDIISDYLSRLLGTLSFASFEAAMNGEITLLGTLFYMRIGKFMGQPSQVIIAERQFVKMQHRAEFDKADLQVLEVSDPNTCLYAAGRGVGQWRPPSRMAAGSAQSGAPYAQQHSQFGNPLANQMSAAQMQLQIQKQQVQIEAKIQAIENAQTMKYKSIKEVLYKGKDTRSPWQRWVGV